MKVLVTAFKPFNNSKNNYSEEVLKYIQNVDKMILDVVYDECYTQLTQKFNLDEYDLIIAMGEARMRNNIMLETQAINIASCRLPDNNNVAKVNEEIIKDGLPILKTTIDLTKFNDVIKLSNDAGKFVCNNLYYHLLHNYSNKSLFIHVPNCIDSTEEYILNAKIVQTVIEILFV